MAKKKDPEETAKDEVSESVVEPEPVDELAQLLEVAKSARPDPRGSTDGRAFEEAKASIYAHIDHLAAVKGAEHPEVQEKRRLVHIVLR